MSIVIFGLHYVAFAVAVACLAVQLFNLRPGRLRTDLRVGLLARIDSLYGISALLSIATGLMRVFVYGKGAMYYATHPIFWTKMAVFATIGLLSAYPTVQFLKNRELTLVDWFANRPAQVSRIRRLIQVELWLYMLIPFLAAQLVHGPHF